MNVSRFCSRLFALCRTPARWAVVFVSAASLMACGDSSSNSDSDGGNNGGANSGDGGSYTVAGELPDYDLGEKMISASNDSTLAEGTLAADGTFEVTFAGESDIEEELQSIAENGSSLDGFPGFACGQEAYNQVGGDIRFVAVPGLTFLENSTPRVVALTSPNASRPDITFPLPSVDAQVVRWIYAEEAVTIETSCDNGETTMDMELDAGWNEYVIDRRDRSEIRQYTGDRPSPLEWKVDE